MMTDFLFDAHEMPLRDSKAGETAAGVGKPRLRVPQRDQIEFRSASLDQLLPSDHPVRVVWLAVEQLDLSAWLSQIKAVEGTVGRNMSDPRLWVALWVYATLQGEGSAREIARLCERDISYQWLCGGVTVNHHTLSDFRSQGGDKWDALLTQMLAGLTAEGLVTLQRVAQDGLRIRASAGTGSFRSKDTLDRYYAEAKEQVETLKRLADENPDELNRRKKAARERAARERLQRVEAALVHCDQLQTQREQRSKVTCQPAKKARASTTDPEARNMKFPNGGYGPGFNAQFSTDTESGIIVGVDVTNSGSDGEQLAPMLDQVQERCGKNPDEALVDGGFATKEAITDAAENHNCAVYAPLKDVEKQLAKGTDPHAPKKGDSPAVAAWRERMGTHAGKQIYKLRPQTAEWVNALCRNRGLWQMPIRSQLKCRTVAILYAISHNILQAVKLRQRAANMST
jgi:transposase